MGDREYTVRVPEHAADRFLSIVRAHPAWELVDADPVVVDADPITPYGSVTVNVAKALRRPVDYFQLSPRRQWDIDSELGLLDWNPTPEEIEQYQQHWRGQQSSATEEPD
jgi:hypothetical protein